MPSGPGRDPPLDPKFNDPRRGKRIAVKLDSVRRHAMSLEAVTEEPHHQFSSFRVRGKIFVTVPPGGQFIHVFLGEEDRELALAMYPGFLDKLLWGAKVLGVRVGLAAAPPRVVKALVSRAYETRIKKDAGPKSTRRQQRNASGP